MIESRLYSSVQFFILMSALLVFFSCHNRDHRTADLVQDRYPNGSKHAISAIDSQAAEVEWLPPMQVPFRELQRYFVRHHPQHTQEFKFQSKGQFEGLFSPAATMGKEGQPSEVKFDKEFVIGVVLPETDVKTDIKAVSLQRLSDGALLFTYKIDRGQKQTFATTPVLAVIVEKQFDGRVVFREEQ